MEVIEDSDVDDYILQELDVGQFAEDCAMREKMRKWICRNRAVFKGFAKIKGVLHKIKLKTGTNLICCPYTRRSPNEEDLERECMGRLLWIGVLENSNSPWAAINVFVPKKDHGVRVRADFRATFELKDEFYQIELDE